MDPLNPYPLKEALSAQGIMIGKHDQLLHGLMDSLQSLSLIVQQVNSQVSLLTPSSGSPAPSVSNPPALALPHPPREPFVPIPECYSGELGLCSHFLLNCPLVFDLQPSS